MNSNTSRKLESNQLGIPGIRLLPNHEDGKCVPFVIVGVAFMLQGQEETPKGKHVGDYFAKYCTSPHTAIP
jgi:hypothetical protein